MIESDKKYHDEALASFASLGNVADLPEQTYNAFKQSDFCSDLATEEIFQLASYMQACQTEKGKTLIQEGDPGDYMFIVIFGRMEVYKKDYLGIQQPMATAGPGMAVGEMSMIDGESRFATCIAMESTTFAVLTRDNIVRLILDHPALGAKILIKLITLLSQRLRHTSTKLIQFMGEQRLNQG